MTTRYRLVQMRQANVNRRTANNVAEGNLMVEQIIDLGMGTVELIESKEKS